MMVKGANKAKSLVILPVLALVILVSGCTGNSGITFGNGVAILNWEPDFSSVESGDHVQLRYRIQNQGGEVADNVYVTVFGIDDNEWGLSYNGLAHFTGDMLPPNPKYNTEGEIKEDYFDLEAPELPEGITQQYSPSIRVEYGYKTSVTKQITLVNEDELRRLIDQGKGIPSGQTITSAGPLSVTVTTGDKIKINDDGERTFPLSIKVSNTGGGVVSDIDSDKDYTVDLAITLPDNLDFTSGSCENDQTITLFKGGDRTLTCEVEIINTPFASEQETIRIDLYYKYYIDASTTISVKGNNR